ncbi:MAG: protein kinase [Planctomycetes bacterium]|nr:protein kinase [Planctomycetota bacterium]
MSPQKPADADPLITLLEECVLRMEVEGSGVVDDVCRDHPEHAAALRAAVTFLQAQDMLAPDDGVVPEHLGDYRLLRRLGGGGMGVVHLAEQMSLRRQVAIKLVRPELLPFAGSRARFRREAEAIARLQHPGIVPVHDLGETNGIPWFAMEYVAGASLGAVLIELTGQQPSRLGIGDLTAALERAAGAPVTAPLPFSGAWWQIASQIVLQAAAAVAHAHQRSVLHRDLKPSNIMLALDGRVQLVDFGLARSAGDAALTRSGAPLGSLAYMAPEQVEGRADIGVAADVFGLGVTLYELLTLQNPFLTGSAEATRQRILAGKFTPLLAGARTLPRDLATVCHCAMAVEPAARYATVQAFAHDLGNALHHQPIAARPPGLCERGLRAARRHPARAALVIALIVLLPLVSLLLGVHVANRDAVARGEAAARAQRLDAALQRGFLLYRSDRAAAGSAFADVLRVDPGNALAVLGAALLVLNGDTPEAIGPFLDRHADVERRHPVFSRLREAPWADASSPALEPPLADIPATPIDFFVSGALALQRADLGDRDALPHAIACLEQAVLLAPQAQVVFLFRLAEAAAMAGEVELLRRTARALLALWPDSAPVLATAGHHLTGYDQPAALAALERAIVIAPDLALAFLYLGTARHVQQDLRGAVAALTRAAELAPTMAEAHGELARVHCKLGELAAARSAIEEALELEELDPELHDTHGEILAAAGDTDAALRAWAQSQELAPRLPWSWFKRGRHLLAIGRVDEGVADLRAAAALAPRFAPIQGTLSRALRNAGDLEGALAAADAAAALDAGSAQYAAEQAQCHWRLRQFDLARTAFLRAIDLAPEDPGLHAALVELLGETGDTEAARAEDRRWRERETGR